MDTCFSCSCFSPRRTEDDNEPLLAQHHRQQSPTPAPDEPFRKLADVLAALSTGKLPSQTQINTFLRNILHSNVLQEDARIRITPDVLRGNGPLSQRGRKVIQDVVQVIEASLRFGMEKNDDDLLQDLFSQLYQVDTESSIALEPTSGPSVKMDEMKKQAGKVKESIEEHAPKTSEISADARMMFSAIKSLLTTFLTSSVFRLILADAISIGRELIAHTASDVSSAALKVHDIAENVGHQAEYVDLGITVESQEDINLQKAAHRLADEGKTAVSGAAQGMQQTIEERKKGWEQQALETEDEVKQKLLMRIQKMVSRAQEDPSSRRAIISILQITRKYAHKFVLASQKTVTIGQEAAEEDVRASPADQRPNKDVPIGFANPSSYPPQPYGPPSPLISIPGIEVDSPHLQHVLQNTKTMIERIAQGHKIDDMMRSLGDVVKHSITAPISLGKSLERLAHEKLHAESDESSSVGTTKHTEQTQNWVDDFGNSSTNDDQREQGHGEDKVNLFALYFSSIGKYLDKALIEPGWATSKQGQRALERLYDATQDLLYIAGDVIADAEEIVGEGVERVKEQMDEPGEPSRAKEGSDTDAFAQEKAKQDAHHVANQWVQDIARFFKQAGDYVDAMERDKTTMKLIHALETLLEDAEDLFGIGRQEMGKAAWEFKSKFRRRTGSSGKLGVYTQWLGWVLPRLLRLLPLGAIPVPRIEVRTDSVEVAVDALWIRGTALKDDAMGGRYGSVGSRGGPSPGASWQSEAPVEGGIGGKLVPDEVMVRQWTEVRVKLAEGLGAAAIGVDDAQMRMGMTDRAGRSTVPKVEATSRVKVHMDGIKACARGMGYYFKYTGSLFDYEDEGILSIDLGTAAGGGRHSGLGLDVELEMDSGDVEMDFDTAGSTTSIPILVVEDVDIESEAELDVPRNRDVQEAISRAGHRPYDHARQIGTVAVPPSRLPTGLALANVVPLFRVLKVHVDMRGIKFRIDKSRHWVFNKLFVEPFAGPLINTTAKRALEDKVYKALEAMSSGMALILMEAKERAIQRRVRYMTEQRRDSSNERYDEEPSGEMKASDVYAVLVDRGPEIFGYYTEGGPQQRQHTETHTDFTGRGVVYSQQTHTHIQHQPVASSSMVIPPPGLTDDEGNIDDTGLLRDEEEEEEMGFAIDREDQTAEVTVAIGTGAQLFPGKGGPYGAPKDTRSAKEGLVQGIKDNVEQVKGGMAKAQEGYQSVKAKAQDGYETVRENGRRMLDRREREAQANDWRSSAFDL